MEVKVTLQSVQYFPIHIQSMTRIYEQNLQGITYIIQYRFPDVNGAAIFNEK